MPSYQLEYFNGRSRAELIRLIFAEAGVKYEDVRIPHEQWAAKYKANTPFGQLPVLTIDGKERLSQSRSIARYLAQEFNLNGNSHLQAGFADMLVETVDEVLYKLPFSAKLHGTSTKEEVDRILNESIYPIFDKIEKRMKESGSNYLVGQDSFTYADLHMLHACQTISVFEEKFMDRYPELKKHITRVADRKNIRKYLDTRPDSLL